MGNPPAEPNVGQTHQVHSGWVTIVVERTGARHDGSWRCIDERSGLDLGPMRSRMRVVFVRFALCLCQFLGVVGAGIGVRAVADQVLFNGLVFTAEPGAPYAEAVGIRAGKIVAVGSRDAVTAVLGDKADAVDLEGRFLMPGLVDTHNHGVQGGGTLSAANIPEDVATMADLRAFVREARESGRGMIGGVLKVTGLPLDFWLEVEALEREFSAGEYEGLAVLLMGLDFHTGWANRALRERVGLTRKLLKELPAEELLYYGTRSNGEPNGFVLDAGLGRVAAAIPKPTPEQLLRDARAGVRYLNSLGITAWLDPYADAPVLGAYRDLSRLGELTAHVAAFPPVRMPPGGRKLEYDPLIGFRELRKEFAGVTNLTVSGVKVFADGVAEFPSQTAAFSLPYRNSGKRGELLFDPAWFANLCVLADREGWMVHVHAIGDRAVTETLNGVAAARLATGNSEPIHSVTHLEFVSPADFPRFRELNVAASFQLFWASADTDSVDKVKPYLDPGIYEWIYPARSILHAGGLIAGGSDWAVSTPDVFRAIYQAETRRGPLGVLDVRQKMPREAMLYAYTRNGAQVMGLLDRIGSIAPGKEADLVLLDRDVLTVPSEELRETRVLWTMVAGRKVYERGPGP